MAANESYSMVVFIILIALFGSIIIFLLLNVGITSKLFGGAPIINTIMTAILILVGKRAG
jgi:hypothetical protein